MALARSGLLVLASPASKLLAIFSFAVDIRVSEVQIMGHWCLQLCADSIGKRDCRIGFSQQCQQSCFLAFDIEDANGRWHERLRELTGLSDERDRRDS